VLKALHTECETGRVFACLQAGWAAYSAVQQKKNVAASFAYYERACKLGSGKGCRWAGHLAYTYRERQLAPNPEVLLRRGCEKLGSAGACDQLGLYLERIANKPDDALPLWDSSCKAGVREACFHLGLARDRAGRTLEGVELMLKACRAAEKPACGALANRVNDNCTMDLGSSAPAGVAAAAVEAAKSFCSHRPGEVRCLRVKKCNKPE
jgi:TPR repeat protein